MNTNKICCHCGIGRVSRPRGLCWNCYYAPGVRDLYPVTSKFGRRGIGNRYGPGLAPTCPTDAPPGSVEKVFVLMERAERGQELWHEQDATLAGPRVLMQAG